VLNPSSPLSEPSLMMSDYSRSPSSESALLNSLRRPELELLLPEEWLPLSINSPSTDLAENTLSSLEVPETEKLLDTSEELPEFPDHLLNPTSEQREENSRKLEERESQEDTRHKYTLERKYSIIYHLI
jgi:hypothetical protein